MRSSLLLAMLLIMSACDDRSDIAATPAPTIVDSVRPPSDRATSAPTTTPAPPASKPAETVLPTTLMLIKGHPFTLEVADDDAEQERGLMFRNALAPDHGMIFVFPDERLRGFWMRNTYIPLDIVYAASNGEVVKIMKLYPQDETVAPSEKPAQYAIELNAGTASRIGLQVGDVLTIPETIKPR